MFGKLTGSFYQMNSRQTKKMFFFRQLPACVEPSSPFDWPQKPRAWAARRRARDAARHCDAGSHYGCWYHIQYALKPLRTYWFIYRRGRIVSHCAWRMLSPIPSAAGGGGGCHIEARRRFVYGEVRGGDGGSGGGGGGEGGGDAALSKTKQGRGRKQFKSEYWSGTSDCTYIPQSHRSHSCVS